MLSSDYLNANPNEPCQPTSMHCFRPLVTGKPGYANVPEPGTTFGEESECSGQSRTHAVRAALPRRNPRREPHRAQLHRSASTPRSTVKACTSGQPASSPPSACYPKAQAPHPSRARRRRRRSEEARGARSPMTAHECSGRTTVVGSICMCVMFRGKKRCSSMCRRGRESIRRAPNPEFQVASADGATVFLTDTQHLTADSGGVGADLYQCEVTEEAMGVLKASLIDVAPGGDVQGQVLGISKDGSWVYFVANGVLAPGAVHGTCQADHVDRRRGVQPVRPPRRCDTARRGALGRGQARLGLRRSTGTSTNLTARVSPDGHWLSFMSSRELTGYDNRDVVSGEPDEEVFLYEAVTGRLTCASCNPTGARPVGEEYEKLTSGNGGLVGGDRVWESADWLAANVPGWTPFEPTVARYQSRYLSDSGRLFFNARDGLVPQAVNESWDVYEFEPVGVPVGEHACSAGSASGSDVFRVARGFVVEGRVGEEGAGCVALMSSGESPQESAFLDASESGGDVFFLTTARLEPRLDYDSNVDVYDAHECTGVSPCSQPPAERSAVCETEASCKASPSPQPPLFGAPASATFSGPGDAPPSSPPSKPVVVRLTRAQRLAVALRVCRRGRVRSRRVSCERAARKRYGPRAKKSSDRGKPVGGKGGK